MKGEEKKSVKFILRRSIDFGLYCLKTRMIFMAGTLWFQYSQKSVGIQVEKSPPPLYAVRRDKRRHWIERIIESSAIIQIYPIPSICHNTVSRWIINLMIFNKFIILGFLSSIKKLHDNFAREIISKIRSCVVTGFGPFLSIGATASSWSNSNDIVWWNSANRNEGFP